MYSTILILKKTGPAKWTLFTEKGIELITYMRVANAEDAYSRAKAWASSWSSVFIKVEDEQQPKKTD